MGGRIAGGVIPGNAVLAEGGRRRYGWGMNKTLMFVAAVLALGACGDSKDGPAEQKMVSIPEALPNIPLPPDGAITSQEGEGDARQLIVTTPAVGDSVVEYYRELLADAPFELISESTNEGRTSFYAELESGQPLWITVEALESGGTIVRLTGAAIRQTANKQQQ
jgi:hypothetical protein